MVIPATPFLVAGRSRISPLRAYLRMLRASSEMAVAISVWLVASKPRSVASSRPNLRASRKSASSLICTRDSLSTIRSPVRHRPQVGEALVEIQRGTDVQYAQPKLRHGHRDARLNPHDDCLNAAKTKHGGQAPQCAR